MDLITTAFAVVLLLSNIASTKIATLAGFEFDSGLILFPLAYIFGDILTEVYGYARARRVIWTGFAMNILMVVVFWVVGMFPPAASWTNQEAYQTILGVIPRIVLASLTAYLVGEFLNSVILAKMKVKQNGKRFWQRALSSTIIGQLFDTTIFILIAFAGVLPWPVVFSIAWTNYVFKILIEIVMLPLTYHIVGVLKKREGTDHYDHHTNFSPFAA
ncbi:MAG: queuosine precursor transporter, partial [Patescibacteria group bacterium]